jgi:hypothetical protein
VSCNPKASHWIILRFLALGAENEPFAIIALILSFIAAFLGFLIKILT